MSAAPRFTRPATARLAAELGGLEGEELHARLRALLPDLALQDRFELLHALGVYHHPESLSGAASTLAETRRLREALGEIVREEGVASLLDAPCGDFHWMRELELPLDYTGVDIVAALVERNRELYERPGRRFLNLDATRDPLPRVDLILSRDLLIHLSLADSAALLANFVASGSRLLLVSHFGERSENREIVSGDYHEVNLCRAPFFLPPPRRIVLEESALAGGVLPDRAMALWEIADVGRALAENLP
jgi:hypothetical protein